jgi:hypothetical protein
MSEEAIDAEVYRQKCAAKDAELARLRGVLLSAFGGKCAGCDLEYRPHNGRCGYTIREQAALCALAALPSPAEAGEKATEWRPMESAPKNGTEVLIAVRIRAGVAGKMLVGHFMPGGHCIEDHPAIEAGWYFWNGSMFDEASEPAAWMPLPAAPSDAKAGETRQDHEFEWGGKWPGICGRCGGEHKPAAKPETKEGA